MNDSLLLAAIETGARQDYFVDEDSIVREIWGKLHTILFIFAGASAEFALNKAVDWLYFTGRLPSDPLGRLFSTVSYAQTIVFSENEPALRAIDTITAIHSGVENNRGTKIPDWAYKDVLFMLIGYSVRSYELLERQLTEGEKQEVLNVFFRVGSRMGLQGLPEEFEHWQNVRDEYLQQHLVSSHYTRDLFRQYQKHLGWVRYRILLAVQALVAPVEVYRLLGLKKKLLSKILVRAFKVCTCLKLDTMLIKAILPANGKGIRVYTQANG